jgi:hypothetical protein
MPSYLKVNYSYALITGEESDWASVAHGDLLAYGVVKWPRDAHLDGLPGNLNSNHCVMSVVINL